MCKGASRACHLPVTSPSSPPDLPSLHETCTYIPDVSCTSACRLCSRSRGAYKCHYAGCMSPCRRLSGRRNGGLCRVRPSARGAAFVFGPKLEGEVSSSSSGTLMLTSSWWEWRVERWRVRKGCCSLDVVEEQEVFEVVGEDNYHYTCSLEVECATICSLKGTGSLLIDVQDAPSHFGSRIIE